MKSTVAVISFACLMTLFHSCYGLKCYSCMSKDDSDPNCNRIWIVNTEYLNNFENNADYCVKIILIYKVYEGLTERLETVIQRSAFTREGVRHVFIEKIKMLRHNIICDISYCQTDGCNSF